MMSLFLMGLALLVMALLGDLTLRFLKFSGALPRWQRVFVTFWIGQAVGTWVLWVLGMMGLPMWMAGAVCFLIYLVGGYWFLWKKGKLLGATRMACFFDLKKMSLRQRCEMGLWILLVGMGCGFVVGIFIMAGMSYPVQGATGLGNWLFKAKWFLLSGQWPPEYFAQGGLNRHLAYPPGFPLLTGWCAWVMGGLDHYWIRALPVALLSAAFCLAASCLQRGLRGVVSLLGLVILFTGYFGQVILWGFYAEPMLLFGLTIVVLILVKSDELEGSLPILALSLGALVWVKQEGLILALLLSGFLWVKAGSWEIERGGLVKFFGMALAIWLVPWRVYAFLGHGKDENFSLARLFENGNWERLSQSWMAYRDLLWENGAYFGAAWWLLPLLAYVAFWRRNELAFLLSAVSLIYVGVVILAMAGSVQEDFEWHLGAATRVLLVPSFLLWLGFGAAAKTRAQEFDDLRIKN